MIAMFYIRKVRKNLPVILSLSLCLIEGENEVQSGGRRGGHVVFQRNSKDRGNLHEAEGAFSVKINNDLIANYEIAQH